jgi:hypothetical protein
VLLPLSWIALLAEGWIASRWHKARVLLHLGVQQVHQESFFFTLPFFLATTNWYSPQSVFTSLLIVAGLASMIDPLYHGKLAQRRWAHLAFHALAVFITVLTAAPMLWQLTTDQSLLIAAACMVLLSIPAGARALVQPRWFHWTALVAGAFALGACAWWLRWAIPPSTLWVSEGTATWTVDAGAREPGEHVGAVRAADLADHALYVWTAIRAPRGLHEAVAHRWLHDGVEVDRIDLEITGGRPEGYRAWSFKRGFPDDARDQWEVQVITAGGQLIGVVRFVVV